MCEMINEDLASMAKTSSLQNMNWNGLKCYEKFLERYRFGFNGKEMDNETYGSGNVYDYGFRIYNPRLGRFLSIDPLTRKFPAYTPYQYASNMPVTATDLDGLESSKDKNETVNPSTPPSSNKPLQDNLPQPKRPEGLVPPTQPTTQLPTTPPGASPLKPNAPTNYVEQSIPFNKPQAAYLPVEGVGVEGSFSIKGVVNVNQNSGGQWQATVGASGSTPAGQSGNAEFSGNVQILQNGKVVSSAPLIKPTGSGIYETGTYPVGTTTLQLPTSGTVQVRINAGYTLQVPEGRSVPMPSQTSVTIPITPPIIQAVP